MEIILDPNECTLVAQVRKASASHRVERSTSLLRGKHFPGDSNVVYLGDATTVLLAHLTHPETPVFSQAPKYNEQRWVLETRSSDVEVHIESCSYWAWGLLTSGYLNIIRLRGPLASRVRLMLDMVSSLGQPPWEFAHPRHAAKHLHKHINGMTLKDNERVWKGMLEAARSSLAEQIDAMSSQLDKTVSLLDKNDLDEWKLVIDEDLHMAWQAHAEDNAPGVERALARLEAVMIQLNGTVSNEPVVDLAEGDSPRRPARKANGPNHASERILHGSGDIPFVDLTTNEGVSEEE